MNKNGFTLIELLLVIVIVVTIGLSTTIVFNEVNESTKNNNMVNAYIAIQRAAILYIAMNDKYTETFNSKKEYYVSVNDLNKMNYLPNNLKNSIVSIDLPSYATVKVYISGLAQNRPFINTCLINQNKCIADENGIKIDGNVGNECCN